MPKYVVEREIAGVGKLSADELQTASQKSCSVLQRLGSDIQWVQSYVTDDKLFCVYIAPSEELIQKHAQESRFPATRIYQVRSIVDPVTAEGAHKTSA
jgi:hypothetical protein